MVNVDNASVIDSRVPVDSSSEPIKIALEHRPQLHVIRTKADELDQLRQEMGRLFQVLDNMKEQAHRTEKELSSKRKELVSLYNLTDGGWAIDFKNETLVKLDKSAPLTP